MEDNILASFVQALASGAIRALLRPAGLVVGCAMVQLLPSQSQVWAAALNMTTR